MQTTHRSAAFRPDIEGLRAVAILLVVVYHCGVPLFSGGFIGVDVFFLLSGYLITGMLVSEVEKSSRIDLIHFYARRARRLLPAAAFSMLITLVIGVMFLAPAEVVGTGRAGRATALYLSNVFFMINSADYFAPNVATNPLLHTWSLAVEEQFYLFWPLLIIVGLQFLKSKKALFFGLLTLTVLSFAASIWVTANNSVFAFYALPTRAWEFGAAGLISMEAFAVPKLPARFWEVLGWSGLAGILASAYFLSSDVAFPGWVAGFPSVSTIAVLMAGREQSKRGVPILLNTPPMQMIGKLSYSWYLWHWPFLVFAVALLPALGILGKAAAVVLALLFAAITHYAIENPIRFHSYLIKRPALSLAFAGAISVCSFSAAALSVRMGEALDTPAMKVFTAAIGDVSALPIDRCINTNSAEVKSCNFGNEMSPVRIVLFGDSHAVQWFNPLRHIAEGRGWGLTTMVKSGCPTSDVPTISQGRIEGVRCLEWRAGAMRAISKLHPSLVIRADSTFAVQHGDRAKGTQTHPSIKEWSEGTRRTLEQLSRAGLRVVSLRDTPHFAFDIPTCLARSLRIAWYPVNACNGERSVSVDSAAFEAESASGRDLPQIKFLDLTDHICGEKICPATVKGIVVYRDDNHMTGRFAESLSPILESELIPLLDGS